jgi:hypothetical protein
MVDIAAMFAAIWFRLSFTYDAELLELAAALLEEWRARAQA